MKILLGDNAFLKVFQIKPLIGYRFINFTVWNIFQTIIPFLKSLKLSLWIFTQFFVKVFQTLIYLFFIIKSLRQIHFMRLLHRFIFIAKLIYFFYSKYLKILIVQIELLSCCFNLYIFKYYKIRCKKLFPHIINFLDTHTIFEILVYNNSFFLFIDLWSIILRIIA